MDYIWAKGGGNRYNLDNGTEKGVGLKSKKERMKERKEERTRQIEVTPALGRATARGGQRGQAFGEQRGGADQGSVWIAVADD